jgi:predicted metalloenzyme YecM
MRLLACLYLLQDLQTQMTRFEEDVKQLRKDLAIEFERQHSAIMAEVASTFSLSRYAISSDMLESNMVRSAGICSVPHS